MLSVEIDIDEHATAQRAGEPMTVFPVKFKVQLLYYS